MNCFLVSYEIQETTLIMTIRENIQKYYRSHGLPFFLFYQILLNVNRLTLNLMLLFLSKQQLKIEKKIDSKVKKLLKISLQFRNNQIKLNKYYEKISKNLQLNWPQLMSTYQQEMVRIKKYSQHWNFSDIGIVRDCIKKSMENQTLYILIKKWCNYMEFYLEEMLSCQAENKDHVSKLKKEQKINLVRQQLQYFCEFLFKFGFQLYEQFFLKHFAKQKLSKQKIYQQQHAHFQQYTRNCLTNMDCFKYLYQRFILIIFQPLTKCTTTLENEFQQFLLDKLGISQKYENVYQSTCRKMWEFHTSASLEQKIVKGCALVAEVKQDNQNYLREKNIEIKNQEEPITVENIKYLCQLYCPCISGSIRYIKMLLCMKEEYNDQIYGIGYHLNLFCLSYLDGKYSSQFQILLDSIQLNQ